MCGEMAGVVGDDQPEGQHAEDGRAQHRPGRPQTAELDPLGLGGTREGHRLADHTGPGRRASNGGVDRGSTHAASLVCSRADRKSIESSVRAMYASSSEAAWVASSHKGMPAPAAVMPMLSLVRPCTSNVCSEILR